MIDDDIFSIAELHAKEDQGHSPANGGLCECIDHLIDVMTEARRAT